MTEGPALNNRGHIIEVAGSHFLLVRNEGISLFACRKFWLLHLLNIVLHAFTLRVGVRQSNMLNHMLWIPAGDELVLVAHIRQLLLEAGDGGIVQILLPVEGRRTVIGQQLARILRMNRIGKALRQRQIRRGGFTPDPVGVRAYAGPRLIACSIPACVR